MQVMPDMMSLFHLIAVPTGEKGEIIKDGCGSIDHLSAYVIIVGSPWATLVLDQNKPTWPTVNQWAPVVNIGLFQLISIT